MPITIRHARFPEENSQVLALFASYAESLGVDLTFQNFQKEVASFPGKYASSQGGALLLAEATDTDSNNNDANANRLIGCVALRYNTPTWCEMKRLYVTPQTRGTGTGEKLVAADNPASKGPRIPGNATGYTAGDGGCAEAVSTVWV